VEEKKKEYRYGRGGVIYYYHELLLEGMSRDVGEDEEVG
jgi:hypothetical protein